MSVLYGSAVASTGGNARQSTRSFAHARKRETLSVYDGTPTTSDQLVLALVKSSDLCKDITFWTDGGGTGGSIDVGLYTVDLSNNGLTLTVVDQDLFAATQVTGTPIAYDAKISVFDQSTTCDDVMDRGKTFWALAALGAATYTADPGVTFAVVATPDVTVDAANEMGFEVQYVAGD